MSLRRGLFLIFPVSTVLLAFGGGEDHWTPIGLTPAAEAGTPRNSQDGRPQDVAEGYLGAVEAMAWTEVVTHEHPAALKGFRSYLEVVLFPGSDPSDGPGGGEPWGASPRSEVLQGLMGVDTPEEYLEMSDDEVLLQAFRLLEEDSPGLINAWIDRSTKVLGAVLEGDTLAHVVYRLEWGVSGATPDTEILTLAEVGSRSWKVLESRELGSIRFALGSVLRRIRREGP